MSQCKPKQDTPLRTQLVYSLLGASVPMIIVTLAVVLVTASIVATNVTDETAAALDAQIKRHLDGASYEIAAATTKRFKVVEASLIDPLAYALRDAVAADRPLVAGGTGYTLPVSPTLLAWNYDTQATSDLSPGMATFPEGRGLGEACVSASANTQCACTVGTHAETCSSCQRTAGSGACTKVGGSVDLTTSSVYYSDGTTNPSVSPPTLTARDTARIEASAGVDNWMPALYGRHAAVQQAYMGLELEDHAYAAFRSFPAYDASAQPGSLFACDKVGAVGQCYDASIRGWYIDAKDAGRVSKRVNGVTVLGLGKTIVTEPYQDAGSGAWMVTTARAVYPEGDTDNILIGVVAVDMLLTSIRESILEFSMLETGFGMLVDMRSKTIVAAPDYVYNPEGSTPQTICQLMPEVCETKYAGNAICEASSDGFSTLMYQGADDTEEKELVWKGGCIYTEDGYTLTHAVLVMVPKEEIRRPVRGATEKWDETNTSIYLLVTALSMVTLLVVSCELLRMGTVITKPITIMSDVAKQVTENAFDDDAAAQKKSKAALDKLNESVPEPDEIGDLLREFVKMVSGMTNDGDKKKEAQAAAAKQDPNVKYPPNPILGDAAPPAARAAAAAKGPPLGARP